MERAVGYRLSIFLFGVLTLTGCETTGTPQSAATAPDQQDSISLDEAKQIALQAFDRSDVKPPPRSSDDFYKELDFFISMRPDWVGCEARFTREENRQLFEELPPPRPNSDHYKTRVWHAYTWAQSEMNSGNYNRALEYIGWSNDAMAKAGRYRSNSWTAIFRAQTAVYHAYGGESREARRELNRAEFFSNNAGTRQWLSNNDGKMLNNLNALVAEANAAMFELTGDLERAYELYTTAYYHEERGYEILEKNGSLMLSRARVQAKRGNLLEAEGLIRDAITLLLGRYSVAPNGARLLGGILLEQGRTDEAIRALEKSIELYEKGCTSPENLFLNRARDLLAQALAMEGEWEEALEVYETLESAMSGDRDSYERLFRGSPTRALAWLRTGDRSRAVAELEVALERALETFGEKHQRTAEIRGFLALAQTLGGEEGQALAGYQAVIPVLTSRSREVMEDHGNRRAQEFRLRAILEGYLSLLASVRGTSLETRVSGGDAIAEAFRVADLAAARGVQQALNASGARAQLPDAELSDLARRE